MVLCFENGDRLAASTGPSEAACSTRLPTLVIQAGHSGKEGFIRAIAVSQDGKVLATAGTDFIALWETDTGRQLRQIFLANVRSLSLSRNAGVLAVGSTDGSVSLWDPRKGTKLVDLAAKAELRCTVNNSCSCSGYEVVSSSSVQPSPVALAADGSILYFADAQGTVYKWQKGGACTRFQFRQGSRIKALSLSDDGRRLLVAAQKNGTILDTTNGEIIVEFGEHDGGVSTAALSADGQFAITGGLDHIARLWNVSSGEEIRQIVRPQSITAVAISANGARFVLGDKAGNLLSGRRDLTDTVVFDKSDSDVSTFALVPESNGDTLYFSRADIVEKWDTRSGRKLVRFTGWPKEVGALAISADGRRLAFGGWDGILRTFDFAAGKVVWSRKVGVDIRSVAFSPDSKKLITGGRDTARLWDASTGEFLYSFPRYNNGVLPASFSRGGDAILTGGDDGVLRIWSTYFPYTLRAEFDCGESVTSASFTQDGQVVIIGAGKRVIAWNWVSPSSGILIHRANGGVRAIDVSRDGSTILLADSAGDVLLLDFNTLKPRLHFQNHNDSIYAARFSADDAYVLTGSGTGKVRLWSTQSGALKTELAGHVAPVLAVSFVDSQTALSASMDRTVRAWRLKGADAGQELFRLVSFRNEENQLSHLSGREHAFDSAESWIGGGPDGHFDTNDLEENRGMHWIMPDDPLHALPLEIFMRDYYEPRLLPRLLAGEKLPEIRSLAELNRAQPKVEIVKIDSEPGAASDRTKPSDTVSVIVEVSGSSEEVGLEDKKRRMETGAYDLRLYRDGQLVKQFPAEVDESPEAGKTREQELASWRATREVVDVKSGKKRITFSGIPLPRRAGVKEVEFSAYAFNVDRVKSETARKKLEIPAGLTPRLGKAYIITVGVNVFQNHHWSLSYAANDAREMGNTLKSRLEATIDLATQNKQYKEVVWIPLISDTEKDTKGEVVRQASGNAKLTVNNATKDKIKAVLEVLAGKPIGAERLQGVPDAMLLERANPEDLIIIALSTHGEVDSQGRFYFLPHDIGTGDQLDDAMLKRAVSSEELSAWIRQIDAQDMVMIVDACHSAASVKSKDFKPGPMGDRGLGQLAYDKRMRILAATQVDQYALETEQTKQGLLTYALVEDGLKKGKADFKPKDDKITLSEWLSYATERVPSLYQEWRECQDKAQNNGTGECKLTAKTATPLDNLPAEFISLQQPALFDFAKNKDVAIINKR